MKKIYWNKFPLFVKWYITSKCNLRCIHCYLTEYTKQPTYDQAMRIVDYLIDKKVVGVVFLGGEPFLRQDFCEILQKLSSHNIRCTVSTNGTLVGNSYAKKLRESGLKDCQVSFEGVSSTSNDHIRGIGSFNRAVEGVKFLVRNRIKVTIGFTLTAKNYTEVDKMVSFSKSLGAESVRFELFIPAGTGQSNIEKLMLSKQEVAFLRKTLTYYNDVPISNLGIHVQHPYSNNGEFGELMGDCSFTTGCGAGTTNIIINSDNTISACDILNEQDRTKFSFSDPGEIEHIWASNEVFRKWRGEEMKTEFGNFTEVHQSNCHLINLAYGYEVV